DECAETGGAYFAAVVGDLAAHHARAAAGADDVGGRDELLPGRGGQIVDLELQGYDQLLAGVVVAAGRGGAHGDVDQGCDDATVGDVTQVALVLVHVDRDDRVSVFHDAVVEIQPFAKADVGHVFGTSVGFRELEHALGDVREDELRADGGDARHHDLAHEALDMEFLGVAHAAVGHHRTLARLEADLGGQILRRVRLGAARLPRVIEPGGLVDEPFRRLQFRPAFGERMLDRLVLPDRPVEHDPLTGIVHGAGEGGAADADRLGGYQDPLRIEAVEQVVEALALFADQVFLLDLQPVDEELVRVHGLAAHLRDAADLDLVPVEVGIEQADAVHASLALLARRGPREQQDLVCLLRRRGPHLLAVRDVFLPVPLGTRFESGGVEPGIRLGHAEAGLLLTLDERHEHALPLVGRAVDDDRVRPEDVDVDRRRPAHRSTRLRDRLHHQRCFGDAEAGPAILFGHGNSEPAILGERLVEVFRELSRLVAVEPVVEVEALAEAIDRIANLLLLFRQGEVHPDLPGSWCGSASRHTPP